MKRCTQCREYKDKTEFYKMGFKYLKSECKKCSIKYNKNKNKKFTPEYNKKTRREVIHSKFNNYWKSKAFYNHQITQR